MVTASTVLRRFLAESEKIPGGLGKDKKPNDFNKDDLEAGVKVEMEHTEDRDIAKEIAMDHLTEDKDYYRKLRKMENEA
jgi:hypothetical protein